MSSQKKHQTSLSSFFSRSPSPQPSQNRSLPPPVSPSGLPPPPPKISTPLPPERPAASDLPPPGARVCSPTVTAAQPSSPSQLPPPPPASFTATQETYLPPPPAQPRTPVPRSPSRGGESMLQFDDSEDPEDFASAGSSRSPFPRSCGDSPFYMLRSGSPSVVSSSKIAIRTRNALRSPSLCASAEDAVGTPTSRMYELFPFLQPRRDAQGRYEDNPDFDPTTVYIPRDAWESMGPVERQWWAVKRRFFDAVVFFHKGKFYELLGIDCQLAVDLLGLRIAGQGGNRGGMNLTGVPLNSFARYARVFLQNGYRVCKVNQVKHDGDIDRQLVELLTPGTAAVDPALAPEPSYILAAAWTPNGLGFGFIDAASRTVFLGAAPTGLSPLQVQSVLKTIADTASLYKIVEIAVTGFNEMDDHTRDALRAFAPSSRAFTRIQATPPPARCESDEQQEYLTSLSEAARTAAATALYFLDTSSVTGDAGSFSFQPLEALGGRRTHMTLDASVINGLPVLPQPSVPGQTDVALGRIFRPATAGGRRVLREVISRPLCSVPQIVSRQRSVSWLRENPGVVSRVYGAVRGMPDIQRHAARAADGKLDNNSFTQLINALASLVKLGDVLAECLPDDDFELCEYGPQQAGDLWQQVGRAHEFISQRVSVLPDLEPLPGVSPAYDKAVQDCLDIEAAAEETARSACAEAGVHLTRVVTIGKTKFLVDVPTGTRVPSSWMKHSEVGKGTPKYVLPQMRKLIAQHDVASDARVVARMSALAELQTELVTVICPGISALSEFASRIDVLCAFSRVEGVFPEIIETDQPFFRAEGLVYPTRPAGTAPWVPNDVALGGDVSATMVLTGLNAAGKSLLLRAICATVILGQAGAPVSAENCAFSLTDRVFARLGGRDDIFTGRSTLAVELEDAAQVFKFATRNSLVVLDELGRGTSSADGAALAAACVQKVTEMGCRSIITTHYATVAAQGAGCGACAYHMKAQVGEATSGEVTFLYKLAPGVCPRSYGVAVAAAAGVPRQVAVHAERLADEFHEREVAIDTLSFSSRVADEGATPMLQRAVATWLDLI